MGQLRLYAEVLSLQLAQRGDSFVLLRHVMDAPPSYCYCTGVFSGFKSKATLARLNFLGMVIVQKKLHPIQSRAVVQGAMTNGQYVRKHVGVDSNTQIRSRIFGRDVPGKRLLLHKRHRNISMNPKILQGR